MIAPMTLFKRTTAANKSCEKFTILSQVYIFIWLACKNVSSAPGFLSMEWFTKGEIFTSCFNFDLNRSASKKKMCSEVSIFKPCQKTFAPPFKWQWTGAVRGEAREKLITFLLRGRMIFCYHVNRFLTVSLLSEIFTWQNSNFQGENCSKNAIFGPNSPPYAECWFLLEVKQMPQWVVSSEVLTTHKVWGKVLFDHFQFCSILSDIRS